MQVPLPMHTARSTAMERLAPAPSGTDGHRGLCGGEAIEPFRVAAQELVLGLRWEMPDDLLHHGDAGGPGGVGVRVVGLAHDVVLPDLLEAGDPVVVLDETAEDVLPEQLPNVQGV